MLWSKLITLFEKVDKSNPKLNINVFQEAANILKAGGLVAFPTETVYGLGANALDPSAVKNIYKAKGRPSDNPLIVHISSIDELKPLVKEISKKAESLIRAFWPGPLTIIFKKSSLIPYETSGGLDTVAIRFPKNEVAKLLIKTANLPIAAPSANSSGRPSPTHASHVLFDLDGKIDMIIDGGHCEFGLESTIIDVTESVPCVLRPGSITLEMLEKIVGEVTLDKAILHQLSANEKPKAPGMKYIHYSPNANITIVSGCHEKVAKKINSLISNNEKNKIKSCVIATEQTKHLYTGGEILVIGDRKNPETIAGNLFKMLRKCDFLNMSEVYIESFEETELGLAIMNRLKKAAGYNIINL